jgi:CTP:molybdopterin cytidylyltransferase MocA
LIAAILLADTNLDLNGTPLALQPSDEGETLVEWQVAQLQAAGVEVVVVVLGHEAESLIPLVSGNDVEPIVNERWQDGGASSLRVGATATPRNTNTAVIVWLSRPRETAIIRAVLKEHVAAKSRVTRPFSGDSPGSPVCIDAQVLARLRNIGDGVDVEELLRDYDTLVVRVVGEMPDLRAL